MQKIFLVFLWVLVPYTIFVEWLFAGETPQTPSPVTKIYTTEPVPGGNCVCAIEVTWSDGKTSIETDPTGKKCANITSRKYECTVQPWLSGFQSVIASLIRWIVYIVMLLGVLWIVGLGIAWSFAGGDDVKMKTNLKSWGINIFIGLTILFLFRYILQFLAPWIYK